MSQARNNIGLDRLQAQLSSLKRELPREAKVVTQSVQDMLTDNGPQWAAAMAYYALLSAFPLVLVLAAVASYFIDPADAANRLTDALGDFAPQENRINEIVQNAVRARNQVGLIAFAGLIWTGTRVFGTLTRAMNIAFDADESYSFWKRLLIEAIMFLTIGLLFIVALLSGRILGLLAGVVQFLPARQQLAFDIIQWGIQAATLLLVFFLIYRFVPQGNQNSRAALVGSLSATALFLIASPVFQYYVSRFGQYELIYGSLAIAIIILIWVWLVSLITIFGGEVASHTKMMIIDNEPAETVEERHKERSPMKRR